MKSIQSQIVGAVRSRSDFRAGSPSGSGYALRNGLTGRRDWLEFDKAKNTFYYLLWGNKIAFGEVDKEGTCLNLTVSDCGYPTQTTSSRLNAIFAGLDIPMSCEIRKGKSVFKLNGEEVQEEMVKAGKYLVKIA